MADEELSAPEQTPPAVDGDTLAPVAADGGALAPVDQIEQAQQPLEPTQTGDATPTITPKSTFRTKVEDGVSYHIETRPDGSEFLLGKDNEPRGVGIMIRPPTPPAYQPGATGEAESPRIRADILAEKVQDVSDEDLASLSQSPAVMRNPELSHAVRDAAASRGMWGIADTPDMEPADGPASITETLKNQDAFSILGLFISSASAGELPGQQTTTPQNVSPDTPEGARAAKDAQYPPVVKPGQTSSAISEAATRISGGKKNPEKDAKYPPVHSTATQKLEAMSGQITGSAAKTGLGLIGMTRGAQIGMLAGPYAPVAVPIGAAIGFGAGYLGGAGIEHMLGIPQWDTLPADQRPWAVAGEVIGGGGASAAGMARLAVLPSRLAPSLVNNQINKFLDVGARSPLKFMAGESAPLLTSAYGGMEAETYAPGQWGYRMLAEIGGGLVNIPRILQGLNNVAMSSGRSVASNFSESARQTFAGKRLNEIFAEAGDDAQIAAALLRAHGFLDEAYAAAGIQLTAAQKTGIKAQVDLEARLIQDSSEFGVYSAKQAAMALDLIKGMIVALRSTGDTAAIRTAARMQADRFGVLMDGLIASAEKKAVEEAGKITGDSPKELMTLSRKVMDIMEESLSMARGAESALWEAVNKDIRATATTIVSKATKLRDGMLVADGEKLPSIMENFVNRMIAEGGKTTSGELILFRSRALALGRVAAGKDEFDEARIYGDLADAALADLDKMASQPAFGAYGRIADGYNEARLFTRVLYDKFSRSFAGELLAADKLGGASIRPELALKRAFATGKELGDLQMMEIEMATRFLAQHGIGEGTVGRNLETILDAQERMLRYAASASVDPLTGRLNRRALSKWMEDNSGLLGRFESTGLRKVLEDALAAEDEFIQYAAKIGVGGKIIDKRAVFNKLLGDRKPEDVVAQIINGADPENGLMQLVKLAKRGGATEQLRKTLWDYAINKATDAGGMSIDSLNAVLNSPIKSGGRSLLEFAEANGVMTSGEVERFGMLFNEASRIEYAVNGGVPVSSVVDSASAIAELGLSVIGSDVGSKLAKVSGGHGLIMARAGINYVKHFWERAPTLKLKQVLVEASKNPQLTAALLEKPYTPAEQLNLITRLNLLLIQAGLTIRTAGAPSAEILLEPQSNKK